MGGKYCNVEWVIPQLKWEIFILWRHIALIIVTKPSSLFSQAVKRSDSYEIGEEGLKGKLTGGTQRPHSGAEDSCLEKRWTLNFKIPAETIQITHNKKITESMN